MTKLWSLMLPTVFLLITSTSASLYNDSDPIVQLNVTNFKITIVNTSNAWIVEFYNSWCGHCINFAPVWRAFANQVKGWKTVYKVAAVDCSVDANVPLCREYVVKFFPTIKLFESYTQENNTGILKTDYTTEDSLRHLSIDFLETQNLVDLTPTNASNIHEIQATMSSINFVLIIVEKNNSYLGREIKLDLYDHAGIVKVVRVLEDNSNLRTALNITNVPFAGLFSKDLVLHYDIKVSPLTHTNVVTSVKKILHLDIDEVKEVKMVESFNTQPLGAALAADQVYMVDLENALSNAFLSEVALHQHVNGSELAALKTFVQVLIEEFPGRIPIKNILVKLNEWLDGMTHFRSEDFLQFFHQAQSHDSFIPPRQDWVTCKGSREGLRGYPCSLWLLFHTLTVSAYNSRDQIGSYNPIRVPSAIAGYIKYFFSCSECSQHFQKMAVNLTEDIKTPEDTVLWFWEAHNKVNERLKHDASEDPQHPKIQFPQVNLCSSCRSTDGETWDRAAVVNFLSEWYSTINTTGVALFGFEKTPQSMRLLDFKLIDEPVQIHISRPSTNMWSFSTLDVSLCLTLYISSAMILIAVYFFFMVKRRMKRKLHKIYLPYV